MNNLNNNNIPFLGNSYQDLNNTNIDDGDNSIHGKRNRDNDSIHNESPIKKRIKLSPQDNNPAIQNAPEEVPPIMKLPSEIRCMIYDKLLSPGTSESIRSLKALKSTSKTIAMEVSAEFLQIINLQKKSIRNMGIGNLRELFPIIKSCGSELNYLNLIGFEISDNEFMELIKYCPNLHQLFIDSDEITDIAVIDGIAKLKNLRILVLHWCVQLRDTGVICGIKKLKKLTSLDLIGCEKLTDRAVIEGIANLTELTHLGLHGCDRLTDNAVINGIAKLNKLTSLDLFGYEKLTDVAKELLRSMKTIQKLDLH